MVAPDCVMVSDRAAVLDHGIEGGRLDGEPLHIQFAMPPGGVKGEIRRRAVRIDMGAAARYLASTAGCLDDGALGRGLDPVVE